MIPPGEWIGIVGGGQLGRMMIHAASRMGYQTMVYTDQPDSPATHVATQSMISPYWDLEAVSRFARQCAVATFEFENIPYVMVQRLEEETLVHPSWNALYTSQHRLREKQFVNELGIQTASYRPVESLEQLKKAAGDFNGLCILKTTELGYDGKGQHRIDQKTDLDRVWKEFQGKQGIVEQLVPFAKEISVIAARGVNGEFVPYAPVENVHRKGILDTTTAPADIPGQMGDEACEAVRVMMDALDYIGIMAVEFFVTDDGKLLVNEFAPRPHNSGHWTIDACHTSQFEQHIRAICGCSLGDPSMHSRAQMKNLLGLDIKEWNNYLDRPSTKLHLYGKRECKPGRKMGHVTTTTSL